MPVSLDLLSIADALEAMLPDLDVEISEVTYEGRTYRAVVMTVVDQDEVPDDCVRQATVGVHEGRVYLCLDSAESGWIEMTTEDDDEPMDEGRVLSMCRAIWDEDDDVGPN